MKLSKKAKGYLKKCQLGTYIDPVEDFDWEVWRSANPMEDAAQPPMLSQSMMTQNNQTSPNNQTNQNQGFNFADALPGIGKVIMGVDALIKSGKEKREARQLRKIFDADTKRRMEEQRGNNFYATPYTSGRSSNYGPSYSFQNGGMSMPSQIDYFMEMYQDKEQDRLQSNKMIQGFYDNTVEDKKQKAKSLQQSGFSSLASGLVDGAKFFFQQGGLTEEEIRQDKMRDKKTRDNKELKNVQVNTNKPNFFLTNPNNPDDSGHSKSRDRFRQQEGGEIDTESLYSENFVSPWQESSNDLPEESNAMENWIFADDEPSKDYSINDAYFNTGYPDVKQTSVLEEIGMKESGGNYQAVNPRGGASGKYQFMPTHWGDQIRSFMGLPSDMSKSEVMRNFRNSPEAQESFMQHVYQDIYLPEVEKLRPLAAKYNLTDDQIIKMLHYRGVGDTRKRLQTGNFEVSQEEKRKYNNPDILKYIK